MPVSLAEEVSEEEMSEDEERENENHVLVGEKPPSGGSPLPRPPLTWVLDPCLSCCGTVTHK